MNIINEWEFNPTIHSEYKRYVQIMMQGTMFSHRPIPQVTWIFFSDVNPSDYPEMGTAEFREIPREQECRPGYVKHTDDSLVPLDSVINSIYSEEELLTWLRFHRDRRLLQCDSLVTRHITQMATSGVTPTLSDTEYQELLTYMQALRDMPETETDFTNPTWPTKPSFTA